jgi:hypothetical protein
VAAADQLGADGVDLLWTVGWSLVEAKADTSQPLCADYEPTMNSALHARRMRKLLLWTSVLALALLAACSSGGGGGTGGGSTSGGGNPAGSGAATAASGAAGGAGAGANDTCSHGVKPGDPGVVDVNCGGAAAVKIQVDTIAKDLQGGTCHNLPGQVWSLAIGVIIDITGQHGTYAGPQVDTIEVTTNDFKAATVQGTLDGKLILSNDDAKITVSADGKTAHVEGVGDRNSDTPNAKITVDVTC